MTDQIILINKLEQEINQNNLNLSNILQNMLLVLFNIVEKNFQK